MTYAEIGDTLALVNAVLNGTSALILLAGRVAIAQKRVRTHRGLMIGAFIVSSVFFASYLTRVALTGTHVDPHHGWLHAAYLTILVSHVILAMTVVPLVMRSLFLAFKKRFVEHRRIARFTFPIWLYVSVTGVIVYVVLYRVPV